MTNFVIATNEFRGNGAPERTEYHNVVAWDRLAEICGQFLSKVQRLPARQALSIIGCTIKQPLPRLGNR